MICPRCQTQNSEDAVFCDRCGLQLESPCSNCGESNRRGAKFCRRCGRPFENTPATTPVSSTSGPSPGFYTPGHLAEKILAARSNLEGERKQVTVLFADIKGSTRLLEGLDPEGAQNLLDPILHLMMEAVHRYEGTVNQVLGDGIMALFGAPLAHEDHAVRACYAALAMQDEMRRHREKVGQMNGELQIGVGLNSGEVVVRSIRNDLTMDYSALGHTTHLAARMQEFAGPGSILMTLSTCREVEGFVQVKSLGSIEPKGVSQPVQVFELTGATSARKRLQAGMSRGLTPFVGRKTEIDSFRQLTTQATSSRGQILAMVGEAGLGKSRLVHEFINYHVPTDWRVLEATSVSYGKATPYFPVTELLRRYFGISEGEPTDSIQTRILDQICKLDESLTDAIPPILALLDSLPKDDTESSARWSNPTVPQASLTEALKRFNRMEPQQRRRHTLDALKRVFVRESQRQPTLVVFEDLHWIDGETQAFLDTLVEAVPMSRILLLVNYRPGYTHAWADKTYYTRLRVDPLSEGGTDELLKHLLGSNEDLAPLKDVLIKRTDGNPFFLEETVRSLVETGFLAGVKGAYQPGLRLEGIRVPSTVQTVIANRIDRLGFEEKHLLQMAAVIGVIVPLRLLRSVAGLPQDELQRYLANLQFSEFLYESNLFPEVEYSFKHALTNEVVYGALLHDRRTSLHARVMSALEQMASDKLDEHVETLAHHALRAEIWKKVAPYSREAGNKAMRRAAYREAATYFERALSALEHLPKKREVVEHTIDLRLDLRNALFPLEELERLLDNLRAAESLAETIGDQRRLARICGYLVHYYTLMGDREKATEASTRGLKLAKACGDLTIQIELNYYLGRAYYYMGNYAQGIEFHKRNIESLKGDSVRESFKMECPPSILCRVFLSLCFAETGRFSDAIHYASEAARIASEINHLFGSVYSDFGIGFTYLRKGEIQAAIEVLERGLTLCRAADIPVQFPLIASPLGLAYVLSGRIAQGTLLLEQAVGQTASKRSSGQAFRVAWLGEAYLRAGRLLEATTLAQRALELSRSYQERGREAWILRLIGRIHAHSTPPNTNQVELYYREALQQADSLSMRPLVAHCHLSLGETYAQEGKRDLAQRELSTAVDLYRSMGMTFGLQQAEAALAKVVGHQENLAS